MLPTPVVGMSCEATSADHDAPAGCSQLIAGAGTPRHALHDSFRVSLYNISMYQLNLSAQAARIWGHDHAVEACWDRIVGTFAHLCMHACPVRHPSQYLGQ